MTGEAMVEADFVLDDRLLSPCIVLSLEYPVELVVKDRDDTTLVLALQAFPKGTERSVTA